jgi:hypothetical protein
MNPSRAQVKSQALNLLDDPEGKVFLVHKGGPKYAVSAGSVSLGVATLTVGSHSMTLGQEVTVSQVTSTGNGTFNGSFPLTAVGGTTISYALTFGAPAWASGGIVETGSSKFDEAFQEAYDALFNAFLLAQCPRIKNIVIVTITPGTTSFSPSSNGITDFSSYEELRERLTGSADKFVPLEARDQLSQSDQGPALRQFVWRLDTFYFIGATTSRDVEITYESSGTAPTADATLIGVDGSKTMLAKYAAGVMGPTKGYDELANRWMADAVGPKYGMGQMGGELFRIVQPRVREMQHVQVALKPFSAGPRGVSRRVPYIMAQQPAGVGTAPAQFSTANGTITGTLDGVNAQFFLAYPVSTANIYRNGILMTIGTDCNFGANVVTFLAGQIPVVGDIITAEGWL